MNRERLLLDTVFIQALLNRRDQYHAQAQAILPRDGTDFFGRPPFAPFLRDASALAVEVL